VVDVDEEGELNKGETDEGIRKEEVGEVDGHCSGIIGVNKSRIFIFVKCYLIPQATSIHQGRVVEVVERGVCCVVVVAAVVVVLE
jgi:hypothetical protein